jgi:hypothetical protein
VTELHALGFQCHFHALGDRAVRDALDAVEAARKVNGPSDTRPHLAHLQVVHPDDVPRFARLGATANIQPLWAAHEAQMDELTIPFLGPERASRQYPFGALLRSGARLAAGTPLYRALLSPGGGGPLGRVLHRDLRARSLAERTLVGAPDAPLVASAVAATFAGVLADWLHGLLDATSEEVAHQVWQLLVALHRSR